MKNTLIKILCAVLALSSISVFAGCGESDELVATTAAVEETTEDSKMNISEQADLSKLYEINYSGDDFAGAWQITEGEGSKYKNFVYMFNGNKKVYLVIGTTGYVETYSTDTVADESGNILTTLSAELMFGINGIYTSEFSDDKNTVVLTNIENKATTTMKKLASFSFIPIPDPEPVIDENLLGAWYDDNGEYFYFDKSGIMYNSINGLSFSFSKYSAKDGKVTSTVTTTKEETNSTAYSVSGDTLTYDNYKYKRISVDKLE